MLRHIGVNVRDLVRAKSYYDEFMPFLGYELHISAADQFDYRPISDEHGLPSSSILLWKKRHTHDTSQDCNT